MFEHNEDKKTKTELPKAKVAAGSTFDLGVETPFDFASTMRGNTNSRFAKALELLNEIAVSRRKSGDNKLDIEFRIIDRPEIGLALPAIIGFNKQGDRLGYFGVLLEEGIYRGKRHARSQTIMGKPITVDVDTSDLWDEDLNNAIYNELASISGKEYSAQSFMVAKESLEIDTLAIAEIIYVTVDQCLRSMFTGPKVSVNDLTKHNMNVMVEHHVDPAQTILDMEKRPIHADVISTTSIGQPIPENAQRRENAQPMRFQMARTAVYLDFVFSPVRDPKTTYMREEVFPGFDPVLTISDCVSFDQTSKQAIETPESILFALLSTGQLVEEEKWKMILRKNRGSAASVGNLSYLWNPNFREEWEPKEQELDAGYSRTSQNPTLDTYLEHMMKDTISVALDITRGGRNSWTQELFLLAALGDSAVAAQANCAIWDMMDHFCNGQLGKFLERGTAIVYRDPVAIHKGFTTIDGKEYDLRRLTLTELCAIFAEEAHRSLNEYSCSMVPGGSNGDQGKVAIHDRRELLSHISGCEINGMVDRVYFDVNAVMAFLEAAQAQGLVVEYEGLIEDQGVEQRGVSNFQASAAVRQGSGIYRPTGYNSSNTDRRGNSNYAGQHYFSGGHTRY